jgi:hypothetical protein
LPSTQHPQAPAIKRDLPSHSTAVSTSNQKGMPSRATAARASY